MVNNDNSNLKQVRAPVYIPFKTFFTAIETLEPGIPPILDRSVFPTLIFPLDKLLNLCYVNY